jgi:acetyl esterase/lipase
LVWAHGGGFVAGDLDMAEAHWVALMIAARGVPVLSIDYRKCLRGVKFPVPSDDVLAAWRWATANAAGLGTTPARLHLGGASAGANLTAGVTKRLRDGEGPVPRSLILIYPLVHQDLPRLSNELAGKVAENPSIFTRETVREINLHFVGSEAGLADPYAFAANGDVSGQPPIYVLNSDVDTLRASGEAYAAALREAGVEVVVEYEPGTVHGHLNEPDRPGGASSIDKMVAWIESHS